MKPVRKSYLFALLAVVWLAVFGNPWKVQAQQTLYPPTVYQLSPLGIGWTAGTVNNGGHAVAVASGSSAVTASMTTCAGPAYTSCNMVYANSTGTVVVSSATTSTLTAANANGNSLLAYVETDGTKVTNIAYPQQASTVTKIHIVQNCGTTVTCANTNAGDGIIDVFGSAALSSASPSTASITGLPYTSSTSYVCTASAQGTTAAIAAAGIAINQTSGSAMTLTGPNTVTTVINFRCSGT